MLRRSATRPSPCSASQASSGVAPVAAVWSMAVMRWCRSCDCVGGEAVDEEKNIEIEKDADEIVIDTTKQELEAAAVKDYIATGSRDKKIRLFEAKSGRCVLTLAGHDNWVTDLHFHPNGKYLLSVADDKSMRIWDLAVGRCYRKIYNAHDHFISCFDMKGKLAATGSVDTAVKVWSCR